MDAHLQPGLSEPDAIALLRLIADVAVIEASIQSKKYRLMNDLASLIEADAWAWILSRAQSNRDTPSVVEFLQAGMSEPELGAYVAMMQSPQAPVEYSALNTLRLSKRQFTRSWDQLVTEDEWYGPANLRRLENVGFEHVMYSVKILDNDGLFSGISMKRRTGRARFTGRERRMLHVVSCAVDWLHICSDELAAATYQVRKLTPRQQNVLTLILKGYQDKRIAFALGIQINTVGDHTKRIYRHFGVNSRAELIARFQWGDGEDG